MATSKKSAAPKTDKTIPFDEQAHYNREVKKATKSTKTATAAAFPAKSAPVKAVKPTKAPKPKKVDGVAAALDRFAADKPLTKSVAAKAATKRTVSLAGTTRLSDVPDHEVYGVEELRAKLAEFPRGAIFTVSPASLFICVFNLRGRLIGRIKDGPKPTKKAAKVARADKP